MSIRNDFQTCYNAIRLASFKGDRYDKYIPRHLEDTAVHKAALRAFHNRSDNRVRGLTVAWKRMAQCARRHDANRMASYRNNYDSIRKDMAAYPMQ